MFAIRYKGKMYNVRKGVQETDDKACDRAWYIAKREPATKEEFTVVHDESHKWCNEKYLGMKYSETTKP